MFSGILKFLMKLTTKLLKDIRKILMIPSVSDQRFAELCKLAESMELRDSSTGKTISKRVAYKNLSVLLIMPSYESRCITAEYLKYVSYVP